MPTVFPPKKGCPASDGEALVLEIWGVWGIPLLPLLPGPFSGGGGVYRGYRHNFLATANRTVQWLEILDTLNSFNQNFRQTLFDYTPFEAECYFIIHYKPKISNSERSYQILLI